MEPWQIQMIIGFVVVLALAIIIVVFQINHWRIVFIRYASTVYPGKECWCRGGTDHDGDMTYYPMKHMWGPFYKRDGEYKWERQNEVGSKFYTEKSIRAPRRRLWSGLNG